MQRSSFELRKIRHKRMRKKVKGTALCPRLCVFRSLNHIYAQIIDDSTAQTLASASSLDPEAKELIAKEAKQSRVSKTKKAEIVGSLLTERALNRGIKGVVFDRDGNKYHGRVKALAEAARQTGLQF